MGASEATDACGALALLGTALGIICRARFQRNATKPQGNDLARCNCHQRCNHHQSAPLPSKTAFRSFNFQMQSLLAYMHPSSLVASAKPLDVVKRCRILDYQASHCKVAPGCTTWFAGGPTHSSQMILVKRNAFAQTSLCSAFEGLSRNPNSVGKGQQDKAAQTLPKWHPFPPVQR